jgi:hypothetical protein
VSRGSRCRRRSGDPRLSERLAGDQSHQKDHLDAESSRLASSRMLPAPWVAHPHMAGAIPHRMDAPLAYIRVCRAAGAVEKEA